MKKYYFIFCLFMFLNQGFSQVPFTCEPNFYQTKGGNDFVVYDVPELTFDVISYNLGFNVNCAGYNPVDNFIYALSGDGNGNIILIRIDATGTGENMGILSDVSGSLKAGDFDLDGNYYVTGGGNDIFVIDVTDLSSQLISPNENHRCADWTFQKEDNKLYGARDVTGGFELHVYDIATQWVSKHIITGMEDHITTGGFGSAYSTQDGGIYFAHNNTGKIFTVDRFTYEATFVGQGQVTGWNDGASCPCADSPFRPKVMAENDSICIDSNGSTFLNILENDLATFSNLDSSTFQIIVPPSSGAATFNALTGEIEYEPTGDPMEDYFSYSICNDIANDLTCDTANVIFFPPLEYMTTAQICEGEGYPVGDSIYYETGIFETELLTTTGCDSLVILNLTVNPPTATQLDEMICQGDTILIGNTAYTLSGEYTQILTNSNGCDSTVTLDLTVLFPTFETISATICEGDSYVVGDSIFTETGNFETFFIGSNGCDSTVMLDLTVLLTSNDTLSATVCHGDSFAVGDNFYQNTGTYTTVLTDANGCDSTIVLQLTELDFIATTLDETICQGLGFPLGDSTYYESGTYQETLTTDNGCDSLVTLNLTVSSRLEEYITTIICDGESYQVGNELFSETTTDSVLLTTIEGCDSLVILDLTVADNYEITVEAEICPGETIVTGTSVYDTTGIFIDSLSTIFGCDSIVTTELTVLETDTTHLSFTTCDMNEIGVNTYLLTNQNGCDSIVIETTTIAELSECDVVVTLVGSTLDCDETVGFFGITVEAGTAPFTINWAGPVNGSQTVQNLNEAVVIDNLPSGTYNIGVTDNFGYSKSATWTFTEINSPEINAYATSSFGNNQIDCFGANTGSAAVEVINGTAPFSYLWSNNASTATIENLTADEYRVTVTDNYGCTAESSVELTQPDSTGMTLEVTDLHCFEENTGAIAAVMSGGQAPFSYQLNGGNSQSEEVFSGLPAGNYTLEVTDANGCVVVENTSIEAPMPVDVTLEEDDMKINLGESIMINAFINVQMAAVDSIYWMGMEDMDCPDCLSQEVTPMTSTTYTVVVIDTSGCIDQDILAILVDRSVEVYAPNIFSPNGDGVNDVFHLFTKENESLKIRELQIFDRWGEVIYVGRDLLPNSPQNGWDGTFRGNPVNPDVFVWFATVELFDGSTKQVKGDITLVR